MITDALLIGKKDACMVAPGFLLLVAATILNNCKIAAILVLTCFRIEAAACLRAPAFLFWLNELSEKLINTIYKTRYTRTCKILITI